MEIKYRILNRTPEADFCAARDITQDRETGEHNTMTREQWLQWFRSEHSPIRVISIAVWFLDVSPRFVMHLTRHKVGVEFFVSTRRPDRCQTPEASYNVMMVCNPQSLMSICRRRLCLKAHTDIRNAFWDLKYKLEDSPEPVLQALGQCMVPDCQYRGCQEFKPCGQRAENNRRM